MVFDFGVSKIGLRKILGLVSDALGVSDTQTPINKTINIEDNNITITTTTAGDVVISNGTKLIRLARGAANLPLKVNSAGNNTEFGVLPVAGGGTGQVTLSSGTVLIGAGTSGITTKANPAGAFLGDSDVQNNTGLKKYFDTTLGFRNALNTFTGTVINPLLTADKFIELGFPSFGNYIVYKSGSNYVAKNLNGHTIDYRSSVTAAPETAIQTAITNAGVYGTIMIHGVDDFPLSSSFTGFDILYHQHIVMGHGTRLSLPTGYTGSVFKLNQTNNSSHVQIFGGMIQELTTPSRLWTCFEINSTTTTGVWDIQIHGTRVYSAGKAIAIKTDTNGWSNGSIYDGLFLDACNIAVSFEHTGVFTAFVSGANNNQFSNIIHQAVASTTHGFKDVNGRRNMFLNDYVADFTGAQITMNITANAANTMILGGSATALNFADLSPVTTPTVIRDAYQDDVAYRRKTLSYEDQGIITIPADPASGYIRTYPKATDANNDSLYMKAKQQGAVAELNFFP
jgi:hypothetical protein